MDLIKRSLNLFSNIPKQSVFLFSSMGWTNLNNSSCVFHKNVFSYSKNLCTLPARFLYVNNSHRFSTNNTFLVKIHVESENKYAHYVMECIPSYSETLFKKSEPENQTMTDEEFNTALTKDWCSDTSKDVFFTFQRLTDYCASNAKEIVEPEFTNLCKAISNKCGDLSDDELIKTLTSLSKWPQSKSLNSDNFVTVWSAIDNECVNRVKRWDLKTLLFVADIWYSLYLLRVSKYSNECMWKLTKKVKRMTPQQIVQTLFYMNVSRKFNTATSMYDFEFYLEKSLDDLSLNELAIVCMGFFKSQTPIRSAFILRHLLDKTTQEVDTVHEITLSALAKIFRYCLHISLTEALYNLLDKLVPNVGRLSNLCCIHVGLAGTNTQTFHKDLTNYIAQRFAMDLKSSRIKDIERLTFLLTLFDHDPKTEPDIFGKVLEELRSPERLVEMALYPKCLPSCVGYLSLREIYPEDLINKVLCPEFIQETYGKNLFKLGRELLILDVTMEIASPTYKGNRLAPKLRGYIVKNTISLVPSRTKTKLSATNKVLIEVLDASESLYGGCDNVYIGHVLPHFERPDIVFATNDSGAAVPIPAQLKEALFASVKYAPYVEGQERWHCLVIGGWNSFIRNSTKPLGSTVAKLRQLRLVGYNPILVPWFEWIEVHQSKRNDYLKKKISIS